MNRRGFTITELLIVIVVMGILLTLGVVNLRGSQVSSRDSERKSDIDALALHLESYYNNGNDSTQTLVDCTGGTITHNGGYTIHTFTVGGTLICTSIYNADVLIVGGGGGGGSYVGGGGGGGGFYEGSINTIVGNYTVTVGADGSGGDAVRVDNETNGGNSSIVGGIYNLIALGGGRGTRYSNQNGIAGGSGGGGGGCEGGGNIGGAAQQPVSATGGFGFRGGNMIGSRPNNDTEGRGGGGAGGTGIDSNCWEPGDGGAGRASSISGTSYYYGGGGGGGAYYGADYGATRSGNGGLGGGGGGGAFTNGTPGTGGTGGTVNGETPTLNMGSAGQGVGGAGGANTGGGGGGCGHSDHGGNGGSGIVIIRYLTPGTTTAHTTTYPSTALTTAVTIDSVHTFLRDIDLKAITAPGVTDPAITLISATNTTQTVADVRPQPTFDQYVYQPLKSDGSLCTSNAQECVEFNLYYQLEADKTVYMVMSRHQ